VTTLDLAMPLSASGRFIVDANGNRVRLAGVNWYGAHEDLGVLPGLDRSDRKTIARVIRAAGFNSVRLPFSLWMTEQTAPVPGRYLAANQDLAGATPMQVYDACVKALTGAGLIVIPNCHILDAGWCCAEDDGNGLWYNSRWPAAKFFAAWQAIATRYRDDPLVAAMDIMNEPRRTTVGWRVLTPTWGTRAKTDVAAMYAAVGDLIHAISPDVLIICEGLGYAADLTGVATHPVRLDRPDKVVYSLHDYPWFHPQGQSRQAYLDQMHRNGGFLLTERIAPLWIGEFGNDTRSLANFALPPYLGDYPASAGWWGNFQAWITENDVDWCWWAINPTQPKGTVPVAGRHRSDWGDPEHWGLLTPDWSRPANPEVMDLLRSMIPPRDNALYPSTTRYWTSSPYGSVVPAGRVASQATSTAPSSGVLAVDMSSNQGRDASVSIRPGHAASIKMPRSRA
jgi:endoglucanase